MHHGVCRGKPWTKPCLGVPGMMRAVRRAPDCGPKQKKQKKSSNEININKIFLNMCCINDQITPFHNCQFLSNHFHSGQKLCDANHPLYGNDNGQKKGCV